MEIGENLFEATSTTSCHQVLIVNCTYIHRSPRQVLGRIMQLQNIVQLENAIPNRNWSDPEDEEAVAQLRVPYHTVDGGFIFQNPGLRFHTVFADVDHQLAYQELGGELRALIREWQLEESE